MKKIFKIFLLTALGAGLFNIADAQRVRSANGSGDRGGGRGGSSGQPHVSREAQVRNFSRTADNGGRNYNSRPTPQRDNSFSRPTPQRDQNSRIVPQRNFNNNRTPSGNVVYNRVSPSYRGGNRYYNNYNYRYNNGYYGNGYRNGYGHTTVFMYGPRYRVIPRNYVSIYFGGSPYYYNQGYFYGYYGGYYQPLFPPFGLRIGVLPVGYSRFYIGLDPFYYYNGIYYRQYSDNSYEVVDAPMGATVSSLPRGAKSVVVNGEKLYELNGTYYKADRDSNGNDVYIVVGKNGEINNTNMDNGGYNAPPSGYNNNAPSNVAPQMGDIVNQLPEGSKVTTINGEKLYLTPDGTYLEEESVNGTVQYRVVGN